MLILSVRLVTRTAAVLLLFCTVANSADWPRFRGPHGSGVSDESALPDEIGAKQSLIWRTPVLPGGSSPIVIGKRLFLTAHEGNMLVLLCLHALQGRMVWRRELPKAGSERHTGPNDSATPTPVADKSGVYAFFPEFGMVAWTHDGRERWRAALGPFNPPHGVATSPVLAGGNIVLAADQVSGSSIIAIRASDGKMAWKVDRPSFVGGYSTPATERSMPGQLVVSSPLELAAYSAATGEKLWSAPRMGVMPISVPVFGDGLFFVNSGAVPPFADLAVTFKADKNGDGKLTPDEFPDQAFREAVRAIDRDRGNGDGAIDAAEWNGWLKLLDGLNAFVAVRPLADHPAQRRKCGA